MDIVINGAPIIRPAIAGIALIVSALLFLMISHIHADTANAQADAPQAEVVLEAGEIDSSAVEVGAFAVIVYEQEKPHPILREWEKLITARGYVQAVDAETLTLALGQNGKPQRIALDRIQRLTLVGTPSPEAAEWDSVHIDASRAAGGLEGTLDKFSAITDGMGIGKRIAVKLLVGSFLGGASGLGLGNALASDCTGGCLDLGGVLGFFVGYTAGTAAGVSLVDARDKFIVSLLGSMVGVAGGYRLSQKTEDLWPFVVSSSVMATLASELSRTDYLPPIFMSRKPRLFSVGLVPNSTGHLSAIATLRF